MCNRGYSRRSYRLSHASRVSVSADGCAAHPQHPLFDREQDKKRKIHIEKEVYLGFTCYTSKYYNTQMGL